jgi:AsmA protein
MMKAVKYVLFTLIGVAVLAALALSALLFWIDPNILKDDIQRLAAAQGLDVQLDGDLSWRVFPNIQIATGAVQLRAVGEAEEFARLQRAQLQLALKPLLRKSIVVDGIALEGLKLTLLVDAQGRGNWTAFMGADETASPPEQSSSEPGPEAAMHLAIKKLQLVDSTVNYRNEQTGQSAKLQGLNLSGAGVELNGQPFPLTLRSAFEYSDTLQNVAGDLALSGTLGVMPGLDHFQFEGEAIDLDVEHKQGVQTVSAQATLHLSSEVILADTVSWSLSKLQLQNGRVDYRDGGASHIAINAFDLDAALLPGGDAQALKLNANLRYTAAGLDVPVIYSMASMLAVDESLSTLKLSENIIKAKIADQPLVLRSDTSLALEPLKYTTRFQLDEFNLRKLLSALGIELPEMSRPSALTLVSLAAAVNGTNEHIQLSDLTARLDDSHLQGSASLSVVPDSAQASTFKVAVDKINADHYLPATTEKEASTEEAKVSEAVVEDGAESIALPREAINALNLSGTLKIGQLVLKKVLFNDVLLQVSSRQGISEVKPLSANVYTSPFTLNAELDTRKASAKLHMVGSGKQLPIGKLLEDIASSQELAGVSDMQFDLRTDGATTGDLKKNLNGNIELVAQQLRLTHMNIERAFCQLVARLQQESFTATDWPAFSDLKDTKTKITFVNGVAKIQQLSGGVSKLGISGEGKIDLVKNAFDVVFNTRLTQADQDAVNCKIHNEKLLDRDIPVRCKASFTGVDVTSCLPDFRVIEDIAKEKARSKAEEKAKDLLERKVGEENREAAKQLFDQFFKK